MEDEEMLLSLEEDVSELEAEIASLETSLSKKQAQLRGMVSYRNFLREKVSGDISAPYTGETEQKKTRLNDTSERLFEVIRSFQGEEFTVKSLTERCSEQNVELDKDQIQNSVQTLKYQGRITAVQEGAGRRAAIYQEKQNKIE